MLRRVLFFVGLMAAMSLITATTTAAWAETPSSPPLSGSWLHAGRIANSSELDWRFNGPSIGPNGLSVDEYFLPSKSLAGEFLDAKFDNRTTVETFPTGVTATGWYRYQPETPEASRYEVHAVYRGAGRQVYVKTLIPRGNFHFGEDFKSSDGQPLGGITSNYLNFSDSGDGSLTLSRPQFWVQTPEKQTGALFWKKTVNTATADQATFLEALSNPTVWTEGSNSFEVKDAYSADFKRPAELFVLYDGKSVLANADGGSYSATRDYNFDPSDIQFQSKVKNSDDSYSYMASDSCGKTFCSTFTPSAGSTGDGSNLDQRFQSTDPSQWRGSSGSFGDDDSTYTP